MAITTKTDAPQRETVTPADGGARVGLTAPGFHNMVRDFTMATNLGPEATAYVDKLRAILEDAAQPIRIKMKRLNQPNGAVVFICNNIGIVLTFAEAIRGLDPSVPKSMANIDAANECKRTQGADFRILNIIVVDRFSYGRYDIMAAHISVLLRVANDPQTGAFKLEDMAGSKFTVDNDIMNVKAFVNDNSPHAIPARSDIGFTINMKQLTDPDAPQLNPGMKKHEQYNPILGVTAYVEMIEKRDTTMGGSSRFIPLVHITDIVSVIPSAKMFPIAISIAADIFIGKGMWKNQFSSFEADQPNIGNLVIDPTTNQPWFAKAEEREGFIQMYVDKPALAIDVTEGRARIPGIDRYASPVYAAGIVQEYTDFIGVYIPTDQIPCNLAYTEFVGIVEQGSNAIDSRSVDYLTTIRYLNNNPRVRDLLTRYPEPGVRADIIRDLMTEFSRLYVNQVCVFNAAMVQTLGTCIATQLSLTASFNSMNGIDLGYITNQSDVYGSTLTGITSSASQYGNRQGSWAPGFNIYG